MIWLWLHYEQILQKAYHIPATKQTMFKEGQEVKNHLVSLSSAGSPCMLYEILATEKIFSRKQHLSSSWSYINGGKSQYWYNTSKLSSKWRKLHLDALHWLASVLPWRKCKSMKSLLYFLNNKQAWNYSKICNIFQQKHDLCWQWYSYRVIIAENIKDLHHLFGQFQDTVGFIC